MISLRAMTFSGVCATRSLLISLCFLSRSFITAAVSGNFAFFIFFMRSCASIFVFLSTSSASASALAITSCCFDLRFESSSFRRCFSCSASCLRSSASLSLSTISAFWCLRSLIRDSILAPSPVRLPLASLMISLSSPSDSAISKA
ncbi:hypothetical protein BMS3Abin09_00808 [bacterium BMS3Abin09]|nr:hypothetical protein BMS3Abin09_00808 [bacterium BMS3Abin09]